jgi:hypothetical protein
MGGYTKAEGVGGAIHEGEAGVESDIHEPGGGLARDTRRLIFFYLYCRIASSKNSFAASTFRPPFALSR